ncbi:hypothetical protein BN1263390080 [Stenotrophomonas maltophilia]|nr:hypothetical protein BN1263390080 [Stenotrophomonas maltophilia]
MRTHRIQRAIEPWDNVDGDTGDASGRNGGDQLYALSLSVVRKQVRLDQIPSANERCSA